MAEYVLRTEQVEDRGLVATLIARTYASEAAVETIEVTGKLRALPSHKQELSVLGEVAGQPVCYALFTPVSVNGVDDSGVVLAPFAFDAYAEGVDVAGFLDQAAEYVKAKGYRYIFMYANLNDMKDLGYEDAEDKGFTSDARMQGLQFLVKDLGAGQEAKGHVDVPALIYQ